MRKTLIAVALGITLAMNPAMFSLLGPSPAEAAPAISQQSPDLGPWLLDLLIVRPASILLVAGAVITYPFALLLDPLFNDDPERLKREWLTKNYEYAFERPLGNFNWRARGGGPDRKGAPT